MSRLQVTKMRHELLPFFGNDGCAELFIKFFIDPSNGTNSINETAALDILKNNLASYELMIARDYVTNKGQGISDKDIHPDFTDFIVRTALFHRSVDKVNKLGKYYQLVRSWFEKIKSVNRLSLNGSDSAADEEEAAKMERMAMNEAVPEAAANVADAKANVAKAKAEAEADVDAAGERKPEAEERRSAVAEGGFFGRRMNTMRGGSRATAIKNYTKKHDDIVNKLMNALHKLFPHDPSTTSKVLWDAVYKNWKNLSPESQKFYKSNLQFLEITDEGEEKDITQKDMDAKIDYSNNNKYRVNFIKKNIEDPCPNFFNLIPKVNKSMSNKIWVTDNNNAIVSIETNDEGNTLKQLYCDVFKGDDTNNLPTDYNLKNQYKILHVNIDKLMRRRLYRLQNVVSGKTQPQVPSGPVIDMVSKNIWFRDTSGNFYKETPEGRVNYDMDDPEFVNAFKPNNNCFNTLLKGDEQKCSRYMYECLLNADPDGISECLEFWKSKEFYDVSKDEIHKMHPLVALRTLQKFGFREHEVYDPQCGKNIKKVETKDNWVNKVMSSNFKTKLGADFGEIESNNKLLDYLQLLSEYVNANPKILNKDCNEKTMESEGVVSPSEYAKLLGIQMQIVPSNQFNGLFDTNKLEKLVSSFHESRGIQSGNTQPFTGLNYSAPYARDELNIGFPFQLGGHPSSEISKYIEMRKDRSRGGPDVLIELISRTVNDLKKLGKNIDPIDSQKIQDKARTLKETENELIEIEIYLEEYAKQIKLFGDSDINTVTIDTIKEFVQKKASLRKFQKNGEITLVQIFAKLQEILQQSNEKSPSAYRPLNVSQF